MTEIILHIGYPKAASTTFQQQYFNYHPEVNLLSWHRRPEEFGNFERDNTIWQHRRALFFRNKDKYSDEGVRKDFDQFFVSNKVNVLSSEFFTINTPVDNFEKAERLIQLFPEAKVMMVIRNQLDIIRSFYDMQRDLKELGDAAASHNSFNEWVKMELKKTNSLFDTLYYDQLINHYQNLFGQNNLHVMVLENLKDDSKSELAKLCDFMNVSFKDFYNTKNSANSYQASYVSRMKNKYIPGVSITGLLGRKTRDLLLRKFSKMANVKKSTFSFENQEMVINRFKNSNKNLIETMNINLPGEKYFINQ